MDTPKTIKKRLKDRRESNSFRILTTDTVGIDFYSNDYLGFAKIEHKNNGKQCSTGSRLISGHFEITEKIEAKAATYFGQKAAILYNSGYDANIGFFSCVPQRGDTIIYDELSHASIRDGIRLSLAKGQKFKHNDLNRLETRLKNAEGDIFVVVESIYSMDGNAAPLVELAQLCLKYKAYFIVDEAHSGGIFGDKGEGLVSKLGLNDLVFAKLFVLGKSYGSQGAFYVGSQDLIDYLVNFSNSFIYTTSLPPNVQERTSFNIDNVINATKERKLLEENMDFFNTLAEKYELNMIESSSAIKAIIIPGNDAVVAASIKLNNAGFLVKPILPPTVPAGSERLRICLHSFNTKQEIIDLIDLLK